MESYRTSKKSHKLMKSKGKKLTKKPLNSSVRGRSPLLTSSNECLLNTERGKETKHPEDTQIHREIRDFDELLFIHLSVLWEKLSCMLCF